MEYKGPEKREFLRLEYKVPLAYKICRQETIDKLLQGYTADISPSGLLCNIKDRVNKDDILWLSFDKGTLGVFELLEKRSLIYQNGIIGKVVRIEQKNNNTFNVGIKFITREEKDLTNSFSRFRFTEKSGAEENKQ